MRTSQYFISTLKETPADADILSQQLMLRAGLIRKLSAGLYTWMPLGLRVLRKVENIVREEMNRAGALEVLMPAVQPAELWQETGRWDKFGPQLLKIRDRHTREFCFGPTHEEVITDLMRRELHSYKQLPLNFYQIQTKFRDEIRPRFGVMRAREFLMKDAYSFHADKNSLAETYQIMFDAYTRIFQRLGLKFRPVLADTGSIGGSVSHEFHVLADSGEDVIAYSNASDYTANLELAQALAPQGSRPAATQAMIMVDTPKQTSIEEVSKFLHIPAAKMLKTLLVVGQDTPVVALVLRGDHELNTVKAEKLAGVATPLQLASAETITTAVNCNPGYIGPVALPANIPVIVDRDAAHLADFTCGANQNDKHLQHANWGRDCPEPAHVADLRNVVAGDTSPDGSGHLELTRGIEVGHIFQLGDNYSQAMQAQVLNEEGTHVTLQMGCYGIGVSRIVAAAIEQNNDENGIIWPTAIAPFTVAIVPINLHRSEAVQNVAETLYADLTNAGYEVLFDDRPERPGVMFANMDLIGIPHRLVVSERNLAHGQVEYKNRQSSEAQLIDLDKVLKVLK